MFFLLEEVAGSSATLSGIISDVTSVVTAAIGWMGDFAEVAFANPLIMLFLTLPLVGMGIGLLRRLINL